jgi:DNA-binding XRE family transcriptional regulator
MAKTTTTQKTKNALDILDHRFGVSDDQSAKHEQFVEQAEVAEILFAARKAAGLTQRQLAELAGTTQQVVSQLESADYDGHSLSMLKRLAKAMHQRLEFRMVPEKIEQVAG